MRGTEKGEGDRSSGGFARGKKSPDGIGAGWFSAGEVCARGAWEGCPAGHTPAHGDTGSRRILVVPSDRTKACFWCLEPQSAPKWGQGKLPTFFT